MHRARRLLAAALAIGYGSAPVARAQTRAFVDVGSGAARFDNIPGSTVFTLSPSLHVQRPTWQLAASGTYSVFDRGGWSGQGFAAGSLFTPAWRALRAEVSGRGETSARASGLPTGQALAVARVHLLDRGRGLWLGGTAGGAWRGSAHQTVLRSDLGGWARLADGRIAVSLTRAVVHDSVLRSAVFDTFTTRPDTLFRAVTAGYTEASTVAEWMVGPVELAGSVARRFGRRDYRATSWNLTGTVWLSPRIGVIAGGGRYPADLAQAHPGGRYVTLAMRLAMGATAPRARPAPPPAPGARIELARTGDGRFTLRLLASGAHSVEVTGDFTDWQPVALARRPDGTWTLPAPLAPGTYRLNVRVDGGAWVVPAGLAVEQDEFSGLVGILIVGG